MSKNLVIVESPAKSKTIQKYLGKDFKVLASFGHLRDLIPKEGAVDPDNNFAMHYQIIEKNKKHLEAIATAMQEADALYLATDPDREGEAISWHVQQILQGRQLLQDKPVHRVVFHEITRSAVQEALQNPRELSSDLINAQQARRALDYLVGFNLSPLLWRKIRRGLSAGRVQSPALRLIVEREEEIERFQTQEYWTIAAQCSQAEQMFTAKLTHYQGEKLHQFSITTQSQAEHIQQELIEAANGELLISKVTKKKKQRNPAPPFITSTLQQEAARKLGFSARQTMRVAQQLYEGIAIESETVGLITYMRTDSVNLAKEAIEEIRAFIHARYGKENLPPQPRLFKTKSKNVQEAHEAIRPTSIQRVPENLKPYLTPEQYKLYDLIWKRTVACQMIHALINTVSVDLTCQNHSFRATGSTIAHPGFMQVYQESSDDKTIEEEEKTLPPLKEGDKVTLQMVVPEQHFTEPPPRYSEASLVKALEEYGIGRPSTYATIISTLLQREYVTLEKKRFHPTDVGRIVSHFLCRYFTRYVDYDFTANLEDSLDEISRGEKQWIPVLHEFWQTFKQQVTQVNENVKRKDVTQEELNESCPQCGKVLVTRLGKLGRFIGCSGYPECDYTRNLQADEATQPEPELVDRNCPECNSPLVIKNGRYGKFIGCSHYPKCKYIEPLEKPKDTHIHCPECQSNTLVERKSRYGKIFYSCANYPKCTYAVWNEPIADACPQCHWPILTLKTTKRKGTEKVCPQKTCGFSTPVNTEV